MAARTNFYGVRRNRMEKSRAYQPSAAFIGASWAALGLGMVAYLIGLWNASSMQLNEKGYYFALLVLGLYSAVSLQKVVRDRMEDIPVTGIYYGLSWLALGIAISLLLVGLYNATLQLSEKGFYIMAFALALFGAITVQKNVRDLQAAGAKSERSVETSSERKERSEAEAGSAAAGVTGVTGATGITGIVGGVGSSSAMPGATVNSSVPRQTAAPVSLPHR